MEPVCPSPLAVDGASRGYLMTMIRESVIALCRQGLPDGSSIERVEGLIGITLHSRQVFLINIAEKLKPQNSTAADSHTTSCNAVENDEENSTKGLLSSEALQNPESGTRQNGAQQLAKANDCRTTVYVCKPSTNLSLNVVKLQTRAAAIIPGTSTCGKARTKPALRNAEKCVPFIKEDHEQDEDLEETEENEEVLNSELPDDADREHPSSNFQHFTQGSKTSRSHYVSPLDSMSRMLPPSSSGHLPSTPISSRTNKSCALLPDISGAAVAISQTPDASRARISADRDEQLMLECMDVKSTGGEMERCRDAETEPRPFSCQLCNASFSKKFCLENHIVSIHQVGGRYVCRTCGRQFMQRLRYVTHMDRHNNVRRHVCENCGKGFTYKYSLWAHVRKCTEVDNQPTDLTDFKSVPTLPQDG